MIKTEKIFCEIHQEIYYFGVKLEYYEKNRILPPV